jgi:ABC-type Zn uptake system ZnuABC Zn-binding protein ZnuA
MKEERVKAVLVEPWNDQKLAARVAQEAGARAHLMAAAVGAVKGADTYFSAIEYNIRTLAEALR